jgi:hypothetical protein
MHNEIGHFGEARTLAKIQSNQTKEVKSIV